jgi:hypothetical protein
MTREPAPGQQDFRLMVSPEPFDPAEAVPAEAGGPQATIVQFAALLSEPDIARVKAAYGLRLDRFIPNLAYLERLDAPTADRVRADFLVRAVSPFPQASKLSSDIPATAPLDLIAVLFDDADPDAVSATLATTGAHDLATADDREFGGRLRLRLTLDDTSKVAQVAAVDDITWLEPVPTISTNDVEAFQTIQSGTTGPQAGTIWDHQLHGEGQVINITDEGKLKINHCFFADTPPNTPGPTHRKVLAVFDDSGLPGANSQSRPSRPATSSATPASTPTAAARGPPRSSPATGATSSPRTSLSRPASGRCWRRRKTSPRPSTISAGRTSSRPRTKQPPATPTTSVSSTRNTW